MVEGKEKTCSYFENETLYKFDDQPIHECFKHVRLKQGLQKEMREHN